MSIADKLQAILYSKEAIKAAIEAKGIENVGDILSTYAQKIESIQTGGSDIKWTGHADSDGLKAIGWTDDDIAYYQEHGVNWNEEDDAIHKVPQDNIELYGIVTASNIGTYKDRLLYLPKIDTSDKTTFASLFYNCSALLAIPKLDTSKVTSFQSAFYGCCTIRCIPMLDTSKVTTMYNAFYGCNALQFVPELNTGNVKSMDYMFYKCYSLKSIPKLNTSQVTNMNHMFNSCYNMTDVPDLDTSAVKTMTNMFYNCFAIAKLPKINVGSCTSLSATFQYCFNLQDIQLEGACDGTAANMFGSCYSLTRIILDASAISSLTTAFSNCKLIRSPIIKGLAISVDFSAADLITKDDLLYLINEAAPSSPIVVTLSDYAYDKYIEDVDIIAALENQPNISLAK